MWSQRFLALWASSNFFELNNFFSIVFEKMHMIVLTSDLLYITMYSIIFVFLFLGLNMKIVDILSHDRHLFASCIQYSSEFINKFMYFVRFQIYCHFVNLLNPLPYCFRMFVIKIFSDKLLWLVLFILPLELFVIQTILTSKCRDTTRSWHSCSSYDENLFMIQHCLYYVLMGKLNRLIIRVTSLLFYYILRLVPIEAAIFWASLLMTLLKLSLNFSIFSSFYFIFCRDYCTPERVQSILARVYLKKWVPWLFSTVLVWATPWTWRILQVTF